MSVNRFNVQSLPSYIQVQEADLSKNINIPANLHVINEDEFIRIIVLFGKDVKNKKELNTFLKTLDHTDTHEEHKHDSPSYNWNEYMMYKKDLPRWSGDSHHNAMLFGMYLTLEVCRPIALILHDEDVYHHVCITIPKWRALGWCKHVDDDIIDVEYPQYLERILNVVDPTALKPVKLICK